MPLITELQKFIKQKCIELLGEIVKFVFKLGNFNTSISKLDGVSTQKISKDTEDLNNPIYQLDLSDTLFPVRADTHSWILPLGIIILRFVLLLHVSMLHSFLLLSNTPLLSIT